MLNQKAEPKLPMNLFKPKAPAQSKRAITREVFNEFVSEFSNAEIGGGVELTKILLRLRDKMEHDGIREEVLESSPKTKFNRILKLKSPAQSKDEIRIEAFNKMVNNIPDFEIVNNQNLIKTLLRLRKKIDPEGDLRETKDLETGSGSILERTLTRMRKEKE